MNKLKDIFSKLEEFSLIKKEWQFLDYIYVSNKSIYGLKYFQSIDQLIGEWENCQIEFASRVQGRLKDKYDGYRWDMYLIMFVDEEVSPTDRKYIENNRFYFRKIVISNSEIIEERLPFTLTNTESFETFLFGHDQFLSKLEEQLPDSIIKRLDTDFFKNGNLLSEDSIFDLVVRKLEE